MRVHGSQTKYVTECCNGRLRCYKKIIMPGTPDEWGEGRGGYSGGFYKGTPDRLISEELVYDTNVEFIKGTDRPRGGKYSTCDPFRRKLGPFSYLAPKFEDAELREKADKEMLQVCVDLLSKGHYRYVRDYFNDIYDAHEYEKFIDLLNEQSKIQELLELKKSSKYEYISSYMEETWQRIKTDIWCTYDKSTRQVIERYIIDNYKLPIGYSYQINIFYKQDVYIDGEDDTIECFDKVEVEVCPPIKLLNYEKCTIHSFEIDLEKKHIGNIGSKINFEAIDKALNSNIKEIISRCKIYDKSYPKRSTEVDRYFITLGEERKLINKYEIDKIKNYCKYLHDFKKKHNLMFLEITFSLKSFIADYDDFGIIRKREFVEVYSGILYDDNPLITLSVKGLEEMGVDKFEQLLEKQFKNSISYIETILYKHNKSKIDKGFYELLCNLADNNVDKKKVAKRREDAFKFREDAIADLEFKQYKLKEKEKREKEEKKKREEEKRMLEELKRKEDRKLKNKIKKFFGF